jgi:hypothetical protein
MGKRGQAGWKSATQEAGRLGVVDTSSTVAFTAHHFKPEGVVFIIYIHGERQTSLSTLALLD